MRNTRDLFKKIRDIKGIFHAKMGTIKDRNGKDLMKAEEIKKKWQEYTEELYKKGLTDPDNHDGVVSHLESDILYCKDQWTLGITTNKDSGGDRIPAELFQNLKDDAVKSVALNISANLEKSADHRTGKGQFSFQSQRRVMPKNVQTTTQLCSFYRLAR